MIRIVRCADVADVIRSVNFARENNILLAIRSGGHNAGGLGICDDGLVIDLSLIKYTRVDPQAKTVVAGGGCTWGDIDHATHVFGMATPSGILSTTGVGGLTTGGAYVNFMMDEGEERVKATYGENYERLVTIKNKFDPNNLFRVNQNIKPTVQ